MIKNMNEIPEGTTHYLFSGDEVERIVFYKVEDKMAWYWNTDRDTTGKWVDTYSTKAWQQSALIPIQKLINWDGHGNPKIGQFVRYYDNPNFESLTKDVTSHWKDGDVLKVLGYEEVRGLSIPVVWNAYHQSASSLILNCITALPVEEPKRMITIGEYEFPEPVREPLKVGQGYHTASLSSGEGFTELWSWRGDDIDKAFLNMGIIHLTKEDAITHAKALVKINGGNLDAT